MLLTTPYAYQQNTGEYAPLHPAILQTNRRIHAEAVNILHGGNIWIIAKISAGVPEISAGVLPPPHIARMPIISKKHAGKIKHPALHIKFFTPSFLTPIGAETARSHVTLIMGEESIEPFLGNLWRMSTRKDTAEKFKASSLTLTLCETPFHTKSKLQSTCLQPFGLVYGLRKFTIQGQVEPACAEEILYRARSGLKDTAEIQNISQAYLEKGNAASLAGEPWRALDQQAYGTAFLTHVILLQEAIFATADFIMLRATSKLMNIRWPKVLLACDLYEDAKKAGEILLKSRSLTIQERLYLRLCTARAHRALGEGDDDLRLFNEALDTDGDKSTVLVALAELFSNAAPEHARLLMEQRGKVQRGETVDRDAIRAFWEAV